MAMWWESLNPEQLKRHQALIDSRVRLLGESYETAFARCTAGISDENRQYVIEGPR